MNEQASQQSLKDKLQDKWAYLKGEYRHFANDFPKLARAVKVFAGLAIVGVISGISFFGMIYFGVFGKLPTAEDLKNIQNNEASEIYSADGKLLGKYYVENREIVSYEDISPDIINALIATEDARFFEHEGIDFRSYLRVLFRTVLLRDNSGGGGSTISQQLAKNIYKRQQHSILSIPITKFKEMITARRLEKVYTKDELINLYLNTVPFGGNMFGVEVAANQLFSVSAKDIETQNAAVLVGMLKGNTLYSPIRNPENALNRRNVVLHQMEKYGYLESTIVDSLEQLPIELNYNREGSNQGIATYFREHLRQELKTLIEEYKKPDGEPYSIYSDGLKIYTTIDSRMQQYAEEAVSEHMKPLQASFDKHWAGRKPWGDDKIIEEVMRNSKRYNTLKEKGVSEEAILKNFETPLRMTVFTWEGDQDLEMSPLDSIRYYYAMLNAGFLVMEPGSGAIKAWVGGIDHKYYQYDHVKATRQVGSTFKPIVYSMALERGIEPCEHIPNELRTYIDYDNWSPQNADGKYGGFYSMEGAIRNSVNSVAVDLVIRSGIDSVAQLARQMGVTSKIPRGPAIALGAVDASLYDMIKVYGTLANRGMRQDPIYLARIETSEGDTLVEFSTPKPRRALKRDNAEIMVNIMKSVVDSGTAKRLRYQYQVRGDIAGKTGTTQSHADGWFIGFTPSLVAGAWVGGESPRIRFRSLSLGQGATTALPIWGRFMNKVHRDPSLKAYKPRNFPAPSADIMERLDCAPFFEELPLLDEDSLSNEGGLNAAIDRLLHGLKRDKDRQVNQKPTNGEEQRRQESERIRKHNEELEKQREKKKKRKEFWGKIFKKDKND
jgi:penicillin-binding protein 1A